MSLVDLDTGEIVDQLDEDAARLLTNRIRQCVAVAHTSIISAYKGRAWIALGYASWETYCAGEFGDERMPIPKADRSAVVALLRAEGMSQRAIASSIGVGVGTVNRDLAGVPNGTPADRVVGVDGRSYPAQQPERAEDRGAGEADDREASDIVEPSGPVPGCADDAVPSPAPEPAQHEDEGAADECPPPAAPLPPRLSAEEQAELDHAEAINRRRKNLAAIHSNWATFESLRTNPDRAEILRGLVEHDRQFILELERRVSWKA